MKKLLILFALLACGLTASAQELSATFVQKKTLKAVNKVIPGEGKVTFKAPDYLNMTYDVPEGEYLIIEGMQLKNCVKGKVITIDTSKNARMRKMRDTLLDCIMGNYEKAAQDNDATLIVEQNGDIKTVSMMARKQLPTGYDHPGLQQERPARPDGPGRVHRHRDRIYLQVLDLRPFLLEVGDDVSDGIERRGRLVRDDDPILVLDTHEELEDVQRIGAEVFFYLRLQRDNRRVHAQLPGQDGLDFLIHRFHQSS